MIMNDKKRHPGLLITPLTVVQEEVVGEIQEVLHHLMFLLVLQVIQEGVREIVVVQGVVKMVVVFLK